MSETSRFRSLEGGHGALKGISYSICFPHQFIVFVPKILHTLFSFLWMCIHLNRMINRNVALDGLLAVRFTWIGKLYELLALRLLRKCTGFNWKHQVFLVDLHRLYIDVHGNAMYALEDVGNHSCYENTMLCHFFWSVYLGSYQSKW